MKFFGTLALVMALVGCGDVVDDEESGGGTDASVPDASLPDAPIPGNEIGGAVVSSNSPVTDDNQVRVLWGVSATSPDYNYVWGTGELDGTIFAITLPGETPPAEALNDYGNGVTLGVGFVVVLPTGESVADGRLDDFNIDPAALSSRHAIIYRTGDFTTFSDGEVTWPDEFPEGEIACGVCVDEITGFDSYEPIDCSQLQVTDDSGEFCNWT